MRAGVRCEGVTRFVSLGLEDDDHTEIEFEKAKKIKISIKYE